MREREIKNLQGFGNPGGLDRSLNSYDELKLVIPLRKSLKMATSPPLPEKLGRKREERAH